MLELEYYRNWPLFWGWETPYFYAVKGGNATLRNCVQAVTVNNAV